jgi:hypothetical protein
MVGVWAVVLLGSAESFMHPQHLHTPHHGQLVLPPATTVPPPPPLLPQVRLPVDTRRCDDPHVKAYLLLQAHLGRLPPPISDYLTDTRGVLDNSVRLAQVRGEGVWCWGRLFGVRGVLRSACLPGAGSIYMTVTLKPGTCCC